MTETWSPELYHIVETIVHSQSLLMRKNDEQKTVLAAFRRNGWLAWRPSETGLVPVSEQEWAKGMLMGTTRMKENWLRPRMEWIRPDGTPEPPDWSLCGIAKDISELMVWDYSHPSEETYHEELCDMGGLPETLQMACEETCRLRLSLDLQMAAWRRVALETPEEKTVRERLKGKREARKKMRQQAKSLSGKEKLCLQEQLGYKSRLEVLRSLVPRSGKKKASRKKVRIVKCSSKGTLRKARAARAKLKTLRAAKRATLRVNLRANYREKLVELMTLS